jgi:hypothetical protein
LLDLSLRMNSLAAEPGMCRGNKEQSDLIPHMAQIG